MFLITNLSLIQENCVRNHDSPISALETIILFKNRRSVYACSFSQNNSLHRTNATIVISNISCIREIAVSFDEDFLALETKS